MSAVLLLRSKQTWRIITVTVIITKRNIDYHYRFTFEVDGEFYVLRKVGTHDVIKNP